MTRHLPAAGPALTARPCTHCAQLVVDAARTDTRDPMLLDAAPSDHGRVLVEVRPDGAVLAGVAALGTARAVRVIGRHTYSDHADTCPFASTWNKPARRGGAPRRGGGARRR